MEFEDIETVAVLGAGNMGHGIAEVAALAGYDVALRDINEEFVESGVESIEWSLDKLVERDQVTREDADAARGRVTGLVDLEEAVADADVVVEAVPERMEVKKNVYRELEEYAAEEAVFASNTSSLSITELSEVTDRPEQFCGMHFFNPPVRMELVEVIAGAHTLDHTLDVVEEFATALGKTPVRVHKDSPGFIVNRILVPLMNEAAWLVHGGAATVESVDSAVKYDLGLPMGAFELADMGGIDVAYHVLEYLHEELGEAYEPCPLVSEKVEAGELGEKTGQGFYDHETEVEVPPDAGDEEVGEILLAVMANETAKLVDGDVASADEIDTAVELGAGFPDGPAKMADQHGLERLRDVLVERRDETGAARYRPAAGLETLVTEERGFHGVAETEETGGYETLTVTYEEGDVGHVTLDRSHRLNTITEEMLDELAAVVEELDADEAVRAVLITGAGEKAFSAGADVQSLASRANPIDAVEISRKGQRVFGELEAADTPVVAGIDGYCLGGGMELATAADLRVASARSEFGQPEHDLALLPGWGGTQRLRHVVGEGRAKEIIFTADRYDPETLHEWGFVNRVTGDDELLDRALDLARDLAAGPPIAQRYTKRAMLAGRDDTDAGLEIESQAFGHLLNTEDLMEGVSAFMSDRDPEFEGK